MERNLSELRNDLLRYSINKMDSLWLTKEEAGLLYENIFVEE